MQVTQGDYMTSNRSRTIDNLGPEVSEKYAINQKLYDPSIAKDAKIIAAHAETNATTPYFSWEVDEILGINEKNLPWAHFSVPQGFSSHKRQLYTCHLIPSLGSMEKQKEKLSSLPEDENTIVVSNMIEKLCKIDNDLSYINSKRSQFQKG